jgi:phosphate transport system protein
MFARKRKLLDIDRQDLIRLVTEMGRLAAQQITHTLDALAKRNMALAAQVIDRDAILDTFQVNIEGKASDIIARHPAIAIAREVISAIQIAHDLERLGDLAKNISKRVIVIDSENLPEHMISGLEYMTRAVLEQVEMAVDSYVKRDINEALAVWNSDRQIDTLNNALFRETLAYMREQRQSISACTQILFCVKNLERAGDHATNIAESVHYTITGHLPAGQRPKENVTEFAKLSA